MRSHILTLILVSSLSPTLAFAEAPPAQCNLVDQEALTALGLADHTTTLEPVKTPGANGAPVPNIVMCTYRPKAGIFPSITTTAAANSTSIEPSKVSCMDFPVLKFNATTCRAVIKNTLLMFSLHSKSPSDTQLQATFRSQVERLANAFATSVQPKSTAK